MSTNSNSDKVYETNRPSSPAYLQYNMASHFIKGNLIVLNENKGEKKGPTPACRHFAVNLKFLFPDQLYFRKIIVLLGHIC